MAEDFRHLGVDNSHGITVVVSRVSPVAEHADVAPRFAGPVDLNPVGVRGVLGGKVDEDIAPKRAIRHKSSFLIVIPAGEVEKEAGKAVGLALIGIQGGFDAAVAIKGLGGANLDEQARTGMARVCVYDPRVEEVKRRVRPWATRFGIGIELCGTVRREALDVADENSTVTLQDSQVRRGFCNFTGDDESPLVLCMECAREIDVRDDFGLLHTFAGECCQNGLVNPRR